MPKRPEPTSEFEALSVGRKSLPLLQALVEEFAATGATDWDAETLLRLAWVWVADPRFAVWAIVRQGTGQALGFLAAQMQVGHMGREAYVLAAYARPGVSALWREAGLEALRSWARALGVTRLVARTNRGGLDGLTEPRAWQSHGFQYDSTIMVAEVGRQLGDRDNGQRGT